MKPIKWDSPEGAGRAGWQWGPAAPLPTARLPERANGAEELLKAQITELKQEIAELKQEIAMKDAAFNALLMAKDAEIRRLHADLARSCAAAGGAARPAHARAAGSDGVATSASVPPQLQPAAFTAAPVATASLPRTTSQLRVKPASGPAHAPKAETSVVSASKRPRSSAPAALFDKFTFPEFCDFDSKGNIVVSDHDNHCIQVLRYSDGTILRSFGRAGKAGDGQGSLENPCAFVIVSGLIIVADYGNHRVQVLNYATGKWVRSIRYVCKGKSLPKSNETYPTSVAVNRGGNNVAVKFSNGVIQVFQLDGNLVSSFGQQGNGDCQFSGEGHIAYDKNDNLVVSDSDNNRIQVLSSNGTFLRCIGIGDRSGGLKHPVGFSFDESGDHIIVADCQNNRVQILEYATGSHVRTIGSGLLNLPHHVCIDRRNDVNRYVVADSGHGVLRFLT